MSAKVSAAASANAGANIAGGKTAAVTGAATSGGNAGSDSVAAAPGARSAAGPGSNAGAAAGAGTGGGGRFSSAMADAAQAGEESADAQPGKHSADASGGHSAPSSPALIATAPDIGADVPALLSPAVASPNPAPIGASGKPGLKTSSGARSTAADTAPPVPSEPVMLAMLLAASGMQLSSAGGAGSTGSAGSATDAAAGAADSAGDGRQAAISVTRLAARITAGLPASDPAVDTASDPALSAAVSAAASLAPAPAPALAPAAASATATVTATATASGDANSATPAASVPDAANSATAAASTTSVGAEATDKSASPIPRSATVDTTPAQPSIMTDSSGLPELVRSFAGSTTQTPPVQASISVPVASDSWPHAVAAQVHWFVNNDVQSATLRLSPEHLGPVEVRIDVHDSQVNVNFSAAHADTRAALEQTVPRLREILAGGGLTLGQANVQQDSRPASQPAASPGRPAFTPAQAVEPVAVAAPQGLGLVDEYA